MTQSEINKLHKSIATDFKIVTRKTELWTIPYCYSVLHDIKKLMSFMYIDTISIIMHDQASTPIKVKKYKILYTPQDKDERPGNIDWEDGEGESLSVVIMHNESYERLSPEERALFQRDNLKIPWGPTYIDTNFPGLTQTLSKKYTHSTGGINRIDFN